MTELARRARVEELMDDPAQDPRDLAVALHDLRMVNRLLGGWRVLRRCMDEVLRPLAPGRYTVLDIGTGSGDLPLRLARWARGRGYRLQVLATDLHQTTLEHAREHTAADPDVEVGWADATALHFADGAFDFVTCSTTLHHFEGDAAAGVLREMARVARRSIVVNDLRRSPAALWGARALALTAWRRSRLTRHDGPLSVRRAFRTEELREASERAGLRGARVRAHHPFRLSLVAEAAQGG
jgi:2-polyprenyl-3-methyl-5-hydroxy-6-metoxy-1,4-benzoquinol methylase